MKSEDGLRFGNNVSQNTFKNTPEDDLDTFCYIISHLTSKYRPDFDEPFFILKGKFEKLSLPD